MDAVSPYRPETAISAGMGVLWLDIPVAVSSGARMLPDDPHRLWFVILGPTSPTNNVVAAPWTDRPDLGWPVYTSSGPTLFHNASYPGLIQSAWYVSGTFFGVYRVVWYSTRDT